MPKVFRVCVTLAALFIAFNVTAELYVKYDKGGTAKFSDKPLPGYSIYSASKKTTSFTSSTPANKKSLKIIAPNKKANHASPVSKQKITVMAPSDQETVRSNQGNLFVVGSLTNDNKDRPSVQLYLNDQPYGTVKNALTFNVEGINRGEHKLKLALLSNTGKIIAMSEPITFYMHRNRVNSSN